MAPRERRHPAGTMTPRERRVIAFGNLWITIFGGRDSCVTVRPGVSHMHHQMGQPSPAESLLPQTRGRNQPLERIGDEVDWERFAMLVDEVYSADEGQPTSS